MRQYLIINFRIINNYQILCLMFSQFFLIKKNIDHFWT